MEWSPDVIEVCAAFWRGRRIHTKSRVDFFPKTHGRQILFNLLKCPEICFPLEIWILKMYMLKMNKDTQNCVYREGTTITDLKGVAMDGENHGGHEDRGLLEDGILSYPIQGV